MSYTYTQCNHVDPIVAVVMPVCNASATLEATIQSVLAQSFDQFELIIVDDGSTDDSLARALALAASDTRVRLISRTNGGVSSARNLGASLGKAPLLAFIDADDLWDRCKLAKHVTLHSENPQLAASYARIAFISH
ncbi:MAG: glycosyltransferase family 2 protein, partial [Sphingomonadaceae bacterium]